MGRRKGSFTCDCGGPRYRTGAADNPADNASVNVDGNVEDAGAEILARLKRDLYEFSSSGRGRESGYAPQRELFSDLRESARKSVERAVGPVEAALHAWTSTIAEQHTFLAAVLCLAEPDGETSFPGPILSEESAFWLHCWARQSRGASMETARLARDTVEIGLHSGASAGGAVGRARAGIEAAVREIHLAKTVGQWGTDSEEFEEVSTLYHLAMVKRFNERLALSTSAFAPRAAASGMFGAMQIPQKRALALEPKTKSGKVARFVLGREDLPGRVRAVGLESRWGPLVTPCNEYLHGPPDDEVGSRDLWVCFATAVALDTLRISAEYRAAALDSDTPLLSEHREAMACLDGLIKERLQHADVTRSMLSMMVERLTAESAPG